MTEQFINEAIKNALAGKSNLDESILKARGFSTNTMRHLINNLANIDGNYLEVGLFAGATFCSSFNKNNISIGIENLSQDFGERDIAKELEANISMYSPAAKEVHTHYTDCFDIRMDLIPNDIDIYMYDGLHDEWAQEKALPHFFDKMANTFLYICDDIAWSHVMQGTRNGFEKLKEKITIQKEWILKGQSDSDDPIWHNNLGLFLISKK